MRSITKILFFLVIIIGVNQASSHAMGIYEVSSASMEPTLEEGDYIIVDETDTEHPIEKGTVIVFRDTKNNRYIVHRTLYYAEEGENWVDNINKQYYFGNERPKCEKLTYCPAPRDGYITYGENNGGIDQETDVIAPVPKEQVSGEVIWVFETNKRLEFKSQNIYMLFDMYIGYE